MVLPLTLRKPERSMEADGEEGWRPESGCFAHVLQRHSHLRQSGHHPPGFPQTSFPSLKGKQLGATAGTSLGLGLRCEDGSTCGHPFCCRRVSQMCSLAAGMNPQDLTSPGRPPAEDSFHCTSLPQGQQGLRKFRLVSQGL